MTTWSHDEVRDLYQRAEVAEKALLDLVVEVHGLFASSEQMPKALPAAVKVLLNCQVKAVSEHPFVRNLRMVTEAIRQSEPPGE